jgi:hypothetical protein
MAGGARVGVAGAGESRGGALVVFMALAAESRGGARGRMVVAPAHFRRPSRRRSLHAARRALKRTAYEATDAMMAPNPQAAPRAKMKRLL